MGVNVSATLPALLQERGLTQEQLAKITGIRRTDINALARGRLDAGPRRLAALADALDVTVFDLGAPAAAARSEEARVLDRLRALEEADGRLLHLIAELTSRVEALELRAQSRKANR
jgi:transcriptional regulator with XRE-family HTH domain